jgi:hypothetical protein
MQIIANEPLQSGKERKKVLRRLLAERAHEWQRQTGIRRLFTRIKIRIWAWWKTDQEMEGTCRNDSPDKL